MNIGREKPAMENFVCDLRAAVHTVARKPGFTIVVALMLAVGIATNTVSPRATWILEMERP